jgi:Amiloride-sensitive sodium channel
MQFLFTDNIPDMIYIYIHHVGQFLQISIRNSLTELFTMEGTTYLNLELLISQSLTTPPNPCNENSTTYDNCILDQYSSKISRENSCLLPFLPQQISPATSYCYSYIHAIRSLQHFQNVSSSCLTSCVLVIPDLTLQLEDQYLTNALTFSSFPTNKERKTLFLLLPKDANFIESRHDYTLFSALAEFLGIAGLFFGISVQGFANTTLSILSTLTKTISPNSHVCKNIKTYFMVALGLTSFALVLWILMVFIGKYISYPVGSQISLAKGIPAMAMALCRSKYITAYNFRNNSYESVAEDLIFWQDGLDIQKKIISLELMNSNGEWKTIWDMQFTKFPTDIFSTVIFPLNNQTLQFCDILDMQQYQDLAKVGYIINVLQVQILIRPFLR